MVREFYANAIECDNFQVFVRGKPMSFARSIINQFYNLLDIEKDDYSTYLNEELNLDEVF